MAWLQPKIKWEKEDCFCISPDYERIRGNLLYLQKNAAAITTMPEYSKMKDYTVQDVPLADFFNSVERNLQAVAQAVQDHEQYRTKIFSPNDPVWDWRDLERIEQMQLQIYMDLKAIKNGQQQLRFSLGGGVFGSYIS